MTVRSLQVSLSNIRMLLHGRAGRCRRHDAYDGIGAADRDDLGMPSRDTMDGSVRHRDHHVERGTFIDEEVRDAD
jgi:hypothetical protein